MVYVYVHLWLFITNCGWRGIYIYAGIYIVQVNKQNAMLLAWTEKSLEEQYYIKHICGL